MEYIFNSKLYIGNSNRKTWFKVLCLVIAAIIGICLLIKIIMKDFNPSDVKSIIFSLIIIWCSKMNMGGEPMYVDTMGTVSFDDDGIKIVYNDVILPKKGLRFDETVYVKFSDIIEIDLSRELDCFRIVGKAEQRRLHKKTGQEKVINDLNQEEETFIYVTFDEQQDELKDILQKRAHFIVKEMEEQM